MDRLGNVATLTDQTGSAVHTFEQDAYGNAIESIVTGIWQTSYGGLHLNGREHDSDTSLYFFKHRAYDPTIGIFVSKSPLAPFREHPYAYVHSSPTNFVDPYGLLADIPRIGPKPAPTPEITPMPTPTPGPPRPPYPDISYGNWCGPEWPPKEAKPRPDPRDALDKCCMEHDLCYEREGVVWNDPSTWLPGKFACDTDLCRCL
ncbi:MAG TPA: RHS repeat-associated core domain-containing protein, partial [bacterium]|nr:RHS repeat-associated core domain-containing protein [bacterium]